MILISDPPMVAVIDEALCIGCTLCIQACPVDAIVGASKLMHTVIADECTGCELCVAPCPVDCIAMIETGAGLARNERTERAGRRHAARCARLEVEKTQQAERRAAGRDETAEKRKRATIERVMKRARERLGSKTR